jgi:hypothetical protein
MTRRKPGNWGASAIYLGLGLCAISLTMFAWSAISQTVPTSGRYAFLMFLGLPGGLLCIIVGAVKVFMSMRR